MAAHPSGFQATSRQSALGSRAAQEGASPESPLPALGPLPSEPRTPQPCPGANHTDSLTHRCPWPLGPQLPCSLQNGLSCIFRGLFQHFPPCPSSLKLLTPPFQRRGDGEVRQLSSGRITAAFLGDRGSEAKILGFYLIFMTSMSSAMISPAEICLCLLVVTHLAVTG